MKVQGVTHRARGGLFVFVAVMAALGAGCASGPLVVSSIQSRGNEVKLGFTEARGGRQGIIECQAGDDGELHTCRHMQIQFAD